MDELVRGAVEFEYKAALIPTGVRRWAWYLRRWIRRWQTVVDHPGEPYLVVVTCTDVSIKTDDPEGKALVGIVAARLQRNSSASTAGELAVYRVRNELRSAEYFLSDAQAQYGVELVERVPPRLFRENAGFTIVTHEIDFRPMDPPTHGG